MTPAAKPCDEPLLVMFPNSRLHPEDACGLPAGLDLRSDSPDTEKVKFLRVGTSLGCGIDDEFDVRVGDGDDVTVEGDVSDDGAVHGFHH
ncbi:hypothetical protein GCM10027413_05080 [Conyzicola nivalis]|uniref:Uncharacterized protein n=1 Tax=Conyzicola nivalis TaxID=1477021 RepID=A0A916SMH4_9MICO|nr:hypothetical protein GCM10010979_21550 [Conyzicola nivalis]